MKTYAEMNAMIGKFLSDSDDAMKQYAALRIKELERENDALRRRVVFVNEELGKVKGGSDG